MEGEKIKNITYSNNKKLFLHLKLLLYLSMVKIVMMRKNSCIFISFFLERRDLKMKIGPNLFLTLCWVVRLRQEKNFSRVNSGSEKFFLGVSGRPVDDV